MDTLGCIENKPAITYKNQESFTLTVCQESHNTHKGYPLKFLWFVLTPLS